MGLAAVFGIILLVWLARGARFRDCATLQGELDESCQSGMLGSTTRVHAPGQLGPKRMNKMAAFMRDALRSRS